MLLFLQVAASNSNMLYHVLKQILSISNSIDLSLAVGGSHVLEEVRENLPAHLALFPHSLVHHLYVGLEAELG